MYNKKYIFLLIVIILALVVVGLAARKNREVAPPQTVKDGRVELNYEQKQQFEQAKVRQDSMAEVPLALTAEQKALFEKAKKRSQ